VVLVEGTQITTDTNGPVTSSILGSGFVVTVNGTNYVITNFHMVVATSGLTVTFYDGNGYAARVLGTDAYSDLAVLTVARASQAEYHPLSLGPSGLAVVGEPVLAIGNPYGLTGSVTVGVISQPGRTIQESAAGNFSIADIIQFSAPINPGNSGGPLPDRDGRVIGITTASVASSQGLGFAIPSGTIIRELPYLITKAGITYIPTSE
jgi:S1-C subfamily serine protease